MDFLHNAFLYTFRLEYELETVIDSASVAFSPGLRASILFLIAIIYDIVTFLCAPGFICFFFKRFDYRHHILAI